MKGQIIERTPGHYTVVVSYKDSATGKWAKKWRSVGESKRKAQTELTKLLTEVQKGLITKPGRMTLEDHLNHWLQVPAVRTLADRTRENYEYNIKKYILPELGRISLAALTPTHISTFEGNLLGPDNTKIRTAQMCHLLLHKTLDFAVKENLIPRNPVDLVDPPKTKRREMQTLTDKEIVLVLGLAKDTAFYPLLHLAMFSGLRRGELLGLRWGDVNFDLGTISVQRSIIRLLYGENKGKTKVKSPKTAKGKRSMPMSASVEEVLKAHYEKTHEIRKALNLATEATKNKKENEKEYIALDDYIFNSNYLGQPYDPSSTSRAWSRLAKKAGIKNVRFHDLRHGFATMCLENGIHPKVVSELLGHSTSAITMDLYSHVSPTMQRDAVTKIDKLIFKSA